MTEDVDAAHAAMDQLAKAFDATVAAIDAVRDPGQALPMSTDLAELVGLDIDRPPGDERNTVVTWKTTAAGLRARTACRLRDDRALSLAGLAKIVGVSRARAKQFVDAARSATPPPKEDSP